MLQYSPFQHHTSFAVFMSYAVLMQSMYCPMLSLCYAYDVSCRTTAFPTVYALHRTSLGSSQQRSSGTSTFESRGTASVSRRTTIASLMRRGVSPFQVASPQTSARSHGTKKE